MRHPRTCAFWFSLVATAVYALPATAAPLTTDIRTTPGVGLKAFRAQQDGDRLRFGTCEDVACTLSATSGKSLQLPKQLSELSLTELHAAGGRRLIVGTGKDEAGPWAVLLAPQVDTPIFIGPTGLRADAEGRKFGTQLQWEPRADGARIVRGKLDGQVDICGSQETLLEPELYDVESNRWLPVALQRLDAARLRSANAAKFVGAAAESIPRLSLRLLELPRTSEHIDANELLDGNPDTTWDEHRSGTGVGEFVTLDVLGGTLDGLRITLPNGRPVEALPASLLITTASETYKVAIARELAIPGAKLEFKFPQRQLTGCVSVILDQIQDPKTKAPVVGLAEVAALEYYANYREFREDFVQNQVRLGELPRALPALAQRDYGPILGALLTSKDDLIRSRAHAKIERCRNGAESALSFALGGSARAYAASQLSIAYPVEARLRLPATLGEGTPTDRTATRSALLKAFRRTGETEYAALLQSPLVQTRAGRIDRLRMIANTPYLNRDATLAELVALWADATFEERYLLATPLAAMISTFGSAAGLAKQAFAGNEPAIKVRILQASGHVDSDGVVAPLDQPTAFLALDALRDPNPRVRSQAAHALQLLNERAPWMQRTPIDLIRTASRVSVRTELEARLVGDPFSFVQQEAALALSNLAPQPSTTTAFLRALTDPVRAVRIAAILGLSKIRSPEVRPAIQNVFNNEHEPADVRAQAATTLGAFCNADDHDALLESALVLRDAYATEGQVRVGLAALAALGKRGKRDLQSDLAPLFTRGVRQPVVAAAKAALAAKPECVGARR
jgi:HEAT repeats